MVDKIKIVTPPGTAVYPWLKSPDVEFGQNHYKINLALEEKAASPLMKKIDDLLSAFLEEISKKSKKKIVTENLPYYKEKDDEGNETGNIIFKFKMKASYQDKKTNQLVPMKPAIFDSTRKPCKEDVWGGSVVRVSGMAVPYFQNKAGVTLRLSAVQVLELATGNQSSGDAYGFNEEEGYIAPTQKDSFEETQSEKALPEEDEDF